MIIYSISSPRPFKPSSPGSKFIQEVILDEVDRKLVATGLKTDVKAMINSYASQVDIERLLKLRDVSGDDSVLFKKQGFFVDSRNMPRNQHEVYKSILNADKIFNTLPADVRKEYESFRDFCNRADFFSVISKFTTDSKSSVPVVEDDTSKGV